MGQQQLLLIILGVIIVGIAIAVGITMFGSASIQSNKDALVNDLNNLAANAYQYKIRPNTLGGGGNSYTGYTVPQKLSSDDNGFSYAVGTVTSSSCQINGTSTMNTAWIAACVVDDTGKSTITYTGW